VVRASRSLERLLVRVQPGAVTGAHLDYGRQGVWPFVAAGGGAGCAVGLMRGIAPACPFQRKRGRLVDYPPAHADILGHRDPRVAQLVGDRASAETLLVEHRCHGLR
jgi:hypothetical protein